MRRAFILSLLLILNVLTLVAAEPPVEKEQHSSLPSGVRFLVETRQTVSSASTKENQPVELVVAANLRGPGNVIALPKGARLFGKVVHSQSLATSRPSEFAIVIERAEWQGGTMQLRAVLSPKQPLVKQPKVKITSEESSLAQQERLITSHQCASPDNVASEVFLPSSAMSVEIPHNPFDDVEVRVDGEHGTIAVSSKRDFLLREGNQFYVVQAGLRR